jgi:PPOX class probable F420-dependent enzyme
MMQFTDEQAELLDTVAFAKLATIMPDGSPQVTVIWYRRDGDTLRMACGETTLKARNIARDQRVAVAIDSPENPYDFIQVRGRAEVVADDALARGEFRILGRRYWGEQGEVWADNLPADSPFVVLVIHPENVSLSRNA